MDKKKPHRFFRVWHRRIGIIIGIQLLLWTFSGIYFAWFHIDNVHGDYERTSEKPPSLKDISDIEKLRPLTGFLDKTKLEKVPDIRVGSFLGQTVVRLYQDKDNAEMYDAYSGQLLSPISAGQAKQLARNDFKPRARILSVELVKKKEGEYKGPVPAYCIAFDNAKATHVYVHANSGTVTAHRNTVWRIFDFLWMLHILDFNEREDMNNWILRVISVLGFITVVSGYLLWGVTFRRKKKFPEPRGTTSNLIL